jgi:VanZ family protein
MTPLAFGYAAVLFLVLLGADFGALAPLGEYVNAYPVLDKSVHFLMYGGLAFVVNAALARRRHGSLAGRIATGSIIVLIAATVEEYSNLLVPCRGWAWSDLVANYVGIVCLGIVPVVCLPGLFRPQKLAAIH